jgi:hypothetical protein
MSELTHATGVPIKKVGPQLSPKWRWDVFGASASEIAEDTALMTVRLPWDVPLWRRILSRIFLGSRWTRITEIAPHV